MKKNFTLSELNDNYSFKIFICDNVKNSMAELRKVIAILDQIDSIWRLSWKHYHPFDPSLLEVKVFNKQDKDLMGKQLKDFGFAEKVN